MQRSILSCGIGRGGSHLSILTPTAFPAASATAGDGSSPQQGRRPNGGRGAAMRRRRGTDLGEFLSLQPLIPLLPAFGWLFFYLMRYLPIVVTNKACAEEKTPLVSFLGFLFIVLKGVQISSLSHLPVSTPASERAKKTRSTYCMYITTTQDFLSCKSLFYTASTSNELRQWK